MKRTNYYCLDCVVKQYTGPRPIAVYVREYENGELELGILEQRQFGVVMDVGNFCYYFTLELGDWTRVGEL